MRVLALLCFTVLASVALAQVNPKPFTCVANVAVQPTLRAEGLTELVGDIVLSCTGGTPTPAGQLVPTTNLRLTLNTNVTSRLLPNGLSDALLLIDEPNPSNQRVCTNPPCSQIATGNGSTPATASTVYLGRSIAVNAVEWNGVPIDSPGTTGITRIYRFTNVRANANQLGLNNTLPTPIVGSVGVTGAPLFTINNPQQTLANVQPGLGSGVVPGSFQACPPFNNSQLFSVTPSGGTGPATAHLFGVELFPNAFKPPGTNTQNVPGGVYNTESGLTITLPGITPPLVLGSANFGTIFEGNLENVPPGVGATIPLVIPLVNNSGATLGTAAAAQTGTISGSNSMTLTPDASGNIPFFYQVTQRTGTGSDLATVDVPMTFSGAPAQAGFTGYIIGVLHFSNSQYPQTTSFAPGSSLLNPYPIFGEPQPSVSNPAIYPYQQVATMVPCTDQGNTLFPAPGKAPAFIGAFDPQPPPPPALRRSSTDPDDGAGEPNAAAPPPNMLVAPRVSNVGLVSTFLPTSNITLTKDPSATWLNATLNQSTTPATVFLSANPAIAGNYSTTLHFSSPTGGSTSVPVSYTVAPGPWFTQDGFTSSASYVSDVVAPGEPFVIFGGDNFGPYQIALPQLGPDGRAVSTLGNTQVLFDGVPAPLYYSVDATGAGQVAGFAPFGLATKAGSNAPTTNVQVVYNNVPSPPITLQVLDAVPGLYTADTSGGGQGAILNQNLSVNSSTNPESVGNLVVLYGGGAGQTNPPGRDGALAGIGAALAELTLPVKVFIDGIQATDIPYSGPAPGLVEGVFQINVRIPAGVRRGTNVPVLVQIEDKQTQPGVTLATQ